MTISIDELLTIIRTDTLEHIESALKIYLATSQTNLNICLKLCEDPWEGWECDTPLTTAIKRGSLEIVTLLFNYGADIHYGIYHGTPMMIAIINGRLDIVQFLLEHKADPDSNTFRPKKSVIPNTNYPYLIGMLGAAHVNRADIGYLLLKYKADVNISSYIYRGPITALTHAAMKWSPESEISYTHDGSQFMRFLISNGAICSPTEFSYLHEKTRQTIFFLFEEADRFFPQLRTYGFPFIKQPIAQHNSAISKPAKIMGFDLARQTPFPHDIVSIIADYLYRHDRKKVLLYNFSRAKTEPDFSNVPTDKTSSSWSYYLTTQIKDASTEIPSKNTKQRRISFCNKLTKAFHSRT